LISRVSVNITYFRLYHNKGVVTVLYDRDHTPALKYYGNFPRPSIIYLKSTASLFTKQKSIAQLSGISNETLCILIAQGAANWRGFKVG